MGSYGQQVLVGALGFLAEKQAAIANNLANVDTTSFKRRTTIAQDTGNRFYSLLDQQLSGIQYTEQSDTQRGILRETGNHFDVAIDGPYWMRVQDAGGNRFYTRNGQLQIGTTGRLETRNGLAVLDQNNQPITLGAGNEAPTDVTFSPNGTIADPTTGQTWGPLQLVELADTSKLTPVGASLFVDDGNQRGRQAPDGLQQGFLEGSNVDSLQELVQMITVERSFTATQKALTGINRLQENLVANMLR